MRETLHSKLLSSMCPEVIPVRNIVEHRYDCKKVAGRPEIHDQEVDGV